MHVISDDPSLTALAIEARWHTIAAMIVLPMVLVGWVVAAVILFGAFEMAVVTALRVHQTPRRAPVRGVSFSSLAAAPVRRFL
jgi:hypothetical protein